MKHGKIMRIIFSENRYFNTTFFDTPPTSAFMSVDLHIVIPALLATTQKNFFRYQSFLYSKTSTYSYKP